VCMCMDVLVCVCVCVRLCVRTCMCTYVYVYVLHTFVCTCVCVLDLGVREVTWSTDSNDMSTGFYSNDTLQVSLQLSVEQISMNTH